MVNCHLCSALSNSNNQQDNVHKSFLAVCCIKRCNKAYCIYCIQQKFDKNFCEEQYKSDTWICYSCQSLCQCILCKGLNTDKKSLKKKPKDLKDKPSNKKQNGIVIVINSMMIKILQENKIQDYFSQEQLSAANPFMRKIMERKNTLYKLILKHPEHPQNKNKGDSQKNEGIKILEIESHNRDQEFSSHKEKESSIKNPKDLEKLIKDAKKAYEDEEDFDIELL